MKIILIFILFLLIVVAPSFSQDYNIIPMPVKIDDEKELSFNGKMYDIKSVQILEDFIEIVAINDVYEEKILEHIKGFIKNLGNFSRNTLIQITFLVLLNYIIPECSVKFYSPFRFSYLFRYTDNNYFSEKPDTGSLPPRCF
jgi:hypothetical protein